MSHFIRCIRFVLRQLPAALAVLIAVPALAQSESGTAAPTESPSDTHWLPAGIVPGFDFVGNVASNPVGGVEQGTEGSYWFMAQSKFDLEQLFGLDNTEVDVQGAWLAGGNLAREKIGSSISPQQTWRPVAGGRLARLTVKHRFDDGLSITAGRAAVNSYFNSSPLNCVFMSNAMCFTPYGPIPDIGITAYPNSSWMAMLRYDFNERWYAQTGWFDYNTDLNLAGKNGVDFSFRNGSGNIVPAEIGYQTSFANARLPHAFRLGMYRNSDGGKSPFYDVNGHSAGLTGKAYANQDGPRVGWYAMVDQTVLRGPGKRNFALFARYFVNTGDAAAVKYFAAAGWVKTGTFKGRDQDTVATFISDTHFDGLEMDYLRDRRVRYGGSGTPHNDEIVGELSYGYALCRGVRLMPNIQYVINPDPVYAPKRTTDIPDALIVGMRLDVQFAQLAGW